MSSDATFKSQAERYGFGSPIGVHWFASSEQTAKTYADERRAFDYQNAEPGIVAAFLNIRTPSKSTPTGKMAKPKSWQNIERDRQSPDRRS